MGEEKRREKEEEIQVWNSCLEVWNFGLEIVWNSCLDYLYGHTINLLLSKLG